MWEKVSVHSILVPVYVLLDNPVVATATDVLAVISRVVVVFVVAVESVDAAAVAVATTVVVVMVLVDQQIPEKGVLNHLQFRWHQLPTTTVVVDDVVDDFVVVEFQTGRRGGWWWRKGGRSKEKQGWGWWNGMQAPLERSGTQVSIHHGMEVAPQ